MKMNTKKKLWTRQQIQNKMQSKGYKISTSGGWEHREVCRKAHGDFPKHWVVHHIDSNPSNNESTNLIALPSKVHDSIHNLQKKHKVHFTREQIACMIRSYVNLDKNRSLYLVINIEVTEDQVVKKEPKVKIASVEKAGSSTYR